MRSLILLICIGATTSVDLYGPPGTDDAKSENAESKSAFTNDPIVIRTGYHYPTAYESRSYDFWYENWPQPHYHGDAPKPDERHQHFPSYNDNYDFSNFITGR
uniref:Secreted protein n=1 Tax=Panagrellus redivivus TaxID=6233 RepID=A0A7E4VY94_PANRE